MKKNIYNILIFALIFLLPTNIFFKFFESSAVVNGLSVDYLLPKLYLSDIIALTCVVFWIFDTRKKVLHWITTSLVQRITSNVYVSSSLLVCILLLIRQLLTPHPLVSVLFFIKVCFFVLVGKIIIDTKITKNRLFSLLLAVTIIFQSVVALIQFITQKSVYGFLFLGETNLQSYAGIAKTTFFGAEKILPYGTTAHPNILAGITAPFLLMLLHHWMKYTHTKVATFINAVAIFLGLCTLIVTQSVSAVLAFLLGILLLEGVHKKIVTLSVSRFSMVLLVTTIVTVVGIFLASNSMGKNTSINRRNYLNTASIQMSLKHPVWGVGLGNFTHFVESVSTNSEVVRFVQPVHSIVLLFVSETGILGILLLFLLIKYYSRNKMVLFSPLILSLLPLMTLDHYLYTLQSGMLLALLFVTFTVQEKR